MTDELRGRIEATAGLLLKKAEKVGMAITGDLRVSEADAAALLCYSPPYLKQMRQEGRGPRAYGVGMNGCRVSYRLDSLAAWVELARLE